MKLTDRFASYLISGGAFAAIGSLYHQAQGGSLMFDKFPIQVAGLDAHVPLWLAFFSTGVGANIVSDMVHGFVLRHLPMDQKWKNREAMLVAIATSCVVSYMTLKFLYPNFDVTSLGKGGHSIWSTAVIAATSQIASEWATDFYRGDYDY